MVRSYSLASVRAKSLAYVDLALCKFALRCRRVSGALEGNIILFAINLRANNAGASHLRCARALPPFELRQRAASSNSSLETRVKILVVTTKSPYPLYEGRALRTYNLIREMAREHEVHLASFVQTPEEIVGIDHMRSLCPVVESHHLYADRRTLRLAIDVLREPLSSAPLQVVKYRSTAMRATIRRLISQHRYDLVHLDMLHLAEYLDLCGDIPTVLMEHNVESVILERRADQERRWAARAYLRYQQIKLQRFEAQACKRATRVVAVSETDGVLLEQMSGREHIDVVPNGVDTEYFREAAGNAVPTANTLVYVGGFTWFPNEDAVRHFAADILPLIAREIPDVSLTVIGKNPDSPEIRALATNPRIRLAGMVDDIRPIVASAAAFIVPLRIGGGTRLKILDALSLSKAIVSTSIGCEGLEVSPGRDIVVADNPVAFAAETVSLLRDSDRARELGQKGRELVERLYDWRAVGVGLAEVYKRAVAHVGAKASAGPDRSC